MFLTQLTKFPCLDLVDNVYKSCTIKIKNSKHKFSNNALETGRVGVNIFGSESFNTQDGKNYNHIFMDYAMPIIRIKRKKNYEIIIENDTEYNFNYHRHGLNDSQDWDGGTTFAYFGPGTSSMNFDITSVNDNNSATLFTHSHNMGMSSTLLYSGMLGLLMISDDNSALVDDLFIYNEENSNNIQLVYQDIDLNQDGTLNDVKLYEYNWRTKYGAINGTSCINWESNDDKYTDKLYYKTNKNVVQITLLNASCSFRNLYFGVCGIDMKPTSFYLVQTDQGYRNPTLVNICSISLASRTAVLIDLNDFPSNEAYLFFYNFDLTLHPIINKGNKIFLKIIQNTNTNTNTNTNIILPVNNHLKRILNNECPNNIINPNECYFKLISNNQISINQLNLKNIIRKIRNIVFGDKPKLIKYLENNNRDFENNNKINYLKYLNTDYFYDLPDISSNTPIRKIIAFYDTTNINGANDYISMGQNRIMIDMLNNNEFEKYVQNTNSIIPTCLFKITDNLEGYINLDMVVNNKLIINLYDSSDTQKTTILKTLTILFDSTNKRRPYNINEWFNLVNVTFSNTTFSINNIDYTLSNILTYKWEMSKYSVDYVDTSKSPEIVNTVKIINNNISENFIVELKAPFGLINYFGKPLGAMYMHQSHMDMHDIHDMHDMAGPIIKNKCSDCQCCLGGTCDCGDNCNCHKTKNPNDSLKQVTIIAGTSDGNIEESDSIMNFTITISQSSDYIGFLDGFLNDNFINMTSKLNQTELIYYCNLDSDISHPIHYHLASTWFDNYNIKNSPNVPFSNNPFPDIIYNDYNQNKYSKDIQIVPPQEKMNFYIKYKNHTNDTVSSLGYMYHCHILSHHDMGMMGQFFVYSNSIFDLTFL